MHTLTTARRAGITLIELLVTTGILLILAGILFTLLLKGKTVWQSSSTHSATRQELQETSWQIARELAGSNVAWLTDGSAGGLPAFSFISARDASGKFITDDQGSPVWQKLVVFYVAQGTTRLLRKEMPRDFAASPALLKALTPGELAAACDGQGKLVSPSVTAFRVAPQADGKSAVLEVQAEAKSAHGTIDRQSRRMTILLNNN